MMYRVLVYETSEVVLPRKAGYPCLHVGIYIEADTPETFSGKMPKWVSESKPVLRNDLSLSSRFQNKKNAEAKKKKHIRRLQKEGYTVNRCNRLWSLYVIELDFSDSPKSKQNAVYVGQTSKDIRERFRQHLAGGYENKSSSIVTRRGKRLLHRLIPKTKYFTEEDAKAAETRLGKRLVDKGYRVYGPQNMDD